LRASVLRNGPQGLQSATGAANLPRAVVGHPDAIHAGLDGALGVAQRLDALEDDGRIAPQLAQQR